MNYDPTGYRVATKSTYLGYMKNTTLAFYVGLGIAIAGGISGAVKYGLKRAGIKLTSTAVNKGIFYTLGYILNPGKRLADYLDTNKNGRIERYLITIYETTNKKIYDSYYITK